MRAVLFDSGGTLARPIGGDWWPKPRPPRFRELVSAAGLPPPDDDEVLSALDPDPPLLSGSPVPVGLAEELDAYTGYYRDVLGELFATFPADLARALAEAAVFDLDQEPYEDTMPALRQLAGAGLRLGLVSNAGPSMELRHRDMGLRDFFDPFIVSAVVGCAKPDPEIYRIALARVSFPPAEVAFVDDVPENVRAAVDLGMVGYLIARGGREGDNVPVIRDLTQLGG